MTEKTMSTSKDGVYSFQVHANATKYDIKRSVEKLFSVKVDKVNVLNRKGKKRVFRGKIGTVAPRRLATVRLSEGTINFEGEI
jgi:large subunit ribosomal protein L23